jgi:hypothetical protein
LAQAEPNVIRLVRQLRGLKSCSHLSLNKITGMILVKHFLCLFHLVANDSWIYLFVYGATGITAVAEHVAQPSVGASASAIVKPSSSAHP